MESEKGSDESYPYYDVIVVGGGIMGSCAAYELSKRRNGMTTLLLEQFDLLHYAGSSHGESRTLRLTYPETYYSSLVLQSSALWEEAESEIGYRVLYPTTHIDLGHSHDPSLQALVTSSRSNSIPFRIIPSTHPALSHHFSSLPQDWIGVVSQGAVIKPTKAVSMFQTLALRNGAVLKDNIQVTSIVPNKFKLLVSTSSPAHTFRCKKCVITAGPWINKLLTPHNINIPVQPLETTVSYWKIKPGHETDYTIQAGFPTFASYGNPYVYGTPSFEYPGLIKIAVHGGSFCDPDKRTWSTHSQHSHYLKKWIRDRFGGRVEAEEGPVFTQSCMYSMTPDEDYVIDFLGGDLGQDVVIAAGFSGHGFKMAPAVGKLVADLVLLGHAPPGVDLNYFKLDRFHKNPKGNFKEFAQQVGRSKI